MGRALGYLTVVLALTVSVAAIAIAADYSDPRCDNFLRAIQSGDFSGAESEFTATMRQAAPPAKLEAIWNQVWGRYGKLNGWEIVGRQPVGEFENEIVNLKFESGVNAPMVRLVFEPSHRQIAGLFVAPAAQAAAAPASPTTPGYVNTAKFYTEDVTVGSAPFAVGGTLTVPTGQGPFPAAVLVGGSGPQDRDETLGPNKPFQDVAEGLGSQGIEVLRYDKRTFAHRSQIDLHHVTVEEEVIADAVNAVTLLRARPEVGGAGVFVIGHSLGALLAPEIAERAEGVAGIVMLAPPGRPILEAMADQMQKLGAASDDIKRVKSEADEIQAHKLAPGTIVEHAPVSYFEDLARRDEIATARKLRKPILILRGGDDYQVIDADLAPWQHGLASTPGVSTETLPGLNHLFMRDENCKLADCYRIAGHVDSGAIERIADFIRNSTSSDRSLH